MMAAKKHIHVDDFIENKKTDNDMKYVHIDCKGKQVKDCHALIQIISMLKFYDNNYGNFDEISKYVHKHKTFLLRDYHHVLDKHLNEDKLSKIESNRQFQIIYQMLQNNNLLCDIENCKIYQRNNRERERTSIECGDRNLSIFIDLIDTIHCYFSHSVDIGYRIIQNLHTENDNNEFSNCNESTAYDPEMRKLANYLSDKRKKMQKIRGKYRVENSKFMTVFADSQVLKGSQFESKSNEEKHIEQNNENTQQRDEMLQQAYLKKQSLHLKKFRKRFIVLKNKHLYCYKNEKQNEMTECIDYHCLQKWWCLKLNW
eukprot:518497_1